MSKYVARRFKEVCTEISLEGETREAAIAEARAIDWEGQAEYETNIFESREEVLIFNEYGDLVEEWRIE